MTAFVVGLVLMVLMVAVKIWNDGMSPAETSSSKPEVTRAALKCQGGSLCSNWEKLSF